MKLALGTVQLGMNYGLANQKGMPSLDDASLIVKTALKNNIRLFDTSPAYGVSELRLGQITESFIEKPNCVTKVIKSQSEKITSDFVKQAVSSFKRSLTNLGYRSTYGLLVHSTSDIKKSGFDLLWKELCLLKEAGLTQKIGFSLYRPSEADYCLRNFDFDIVQIPQNIFDQRFKISGMLERFQNSDVEIHVRSAFLQGLLLMEKEGRPSYFNKYEKIFSKYDMIIEDSKVSKKTALINFLTEDPYVSNVIVGVESNEQLKEVIDASLNKIDPIVLEALASLGSEDEELVLPSNWRV